MNFNWHELDRDGFLSWMIVHLIAAGKDEGRFEQFNDAIDQFNSVTLTIQINGIEVDAEYFVNTLQKVMKHETTRTAEHLAEDMLNGVREKTNQIEDMLEEVAADIRDKVNAALFN